MTTKGRAAILVEAGKPLVIADVEIEDPGPGEILIEVKAAGLCHSDYHYIDGSMPVQMPAHLGHEAAGIVTMVGDGVTQFAIGDHVIPLFSPQCGECRYCKSGRTNQCAVTMTDWQKGKVLWNGERLTNWFFGGFASHIVVPEIAAAKISPEAPLNRAFYAGCGVTTGVASVIMEAKVEKGSSVIVFGLGGIGLNVLQGARLAGASKIIGVDINPEREALGRKFGMTDFVNPREVPDVVAALHAMTDGGADYSFEAVGSTALIKQAIDAAHPMWGLTVIIGVAPFGETIPVGSVDFMRGRSLKGTWFGGAQSRTDVPRIVQWYVDGKLNIDDLVTHEIALDDINEGFAMMKRGESIRTVITRF